MNKNKRSNKEIIAEKQAENLIIDQMNISFVINGTNAIGTITNFYF